MALQVFALRVVREGGYKLPTNFVIQTKSFVSPTTIASYSTVLFAITNSCFVKF